MSGEENSGHSYTEGMQWPSKRELPNYSEKMESENATLKEAIIELIPMAEQARDNLPVNAHPAVAMLMNKRIERARKLLNKQPQSESDKTE